MKTSHNQTMPPIMFWVIWASILFGLIVIQFFIAGGLNFGGATKNISSSTIAICMTGAVISSLIRWFVLPQQTSLASQLPVMIIGLALAESTGLLGIFLIGTDHPNLQIVTLCISILVIIQYAPTYAKNQHS